MSDKDAFSACIEKWRQLLLDLTGRNRMLYYRPSRATLSIHRDEDRVWNELDKEGEIELDESALVPPSAPRTTVPRQLEDADKRIKRLCDLARTFLDEQGVHVIYAVFGWLNWVDETRPPLPGEDTVELRSGRKARRVRSPLLFVPITLVRTAKANRAKYEENAAAETNLALKVLLEQQFGMSISLDPEDDLSPETVENAWKAAISNREHWSVERGQSVLIDSFSFKKIALLRQLERSVDRIVGQPVLRALCGDAQLLLETPAVPSYEDLDEAALASNLNLVVAADASQLKALLAVQRGVNLVIQGPPGTGKSQTITNIVSTMVAQGKRVLFIAEKRQAREIVVENLSKAGLGDVVLHITEEVLGQRGSSRAKRDIVDQLADILEQGAGEYDIEQAYQTEYQRLCSHLNNYTDKLHTPIGPARSSTPFQLMAARAGSHHELAKDLTVPLPSVKQATEAWYEQALELACRIDDLGDQVLTSAKGPWLEAQPLRWDSTLETELTSSLQILVDAPRVLGDLLTVHQKSSDPEVEWTFRRVESLIVLLSAVGEHFVARQRFLGVFTPTYRRTKKAYSQFHSKGWAEETRAHDTAFLLRNQLQKIQRAQANIERVFPREHETESLSKLAAFAKDLLESINTAPYAMQVQSRCLDASEIGLHEVFQQLVHARAPGEKLSDMFVATLSRSWAHEASESDPSLLTEGKELNRKIDKLRRFEARAIMSARAHVLNAVAPYRSSSIVMAPSDSELGILRSQIHAKRRKPLRWLFAKSANLILQMKPCIVASPLAVAQFLQFEAYEFDVVVFDEASQIPTADAVVPITRAQQVVIVGDSQQMPPTSFFDKAVTFEADDSDEVTYESVLQNCEALLPSLPLTWHYRSLDERLITFSNRSFYGGKLLTFPSAWLEHPELGVKFVYLPSAVYGRGGSRANPDEANHVIEILKEELTSNPEHEVGVTAMSIAQSTEIQARLEDAALTSPVIRSWLEARGRARNLETVQGDEFDVSILSFGYGRDASGNLQLNFGPLSRENGYKRLNVAVTRAKKKMVVVSSIRGADIPVRRISEGGQRVRQFLEYAEYGPSALNATIGIGVQGVDIFESPLEQEVASQIRALGWSVDTQVGVNRFRVDIGIVHPKYPGRYLAGVECDGATYHNCETARDRDIGRQQVLEKLGWRLFRVWSPDWFRAKDRVIHDLHEFLSRLLDEDPDGDKVLRSPSPQPTDPETNLASAPNFRPSELGIRPGTMIYRLEGPQKPPTNQGDIVAWTNWLSLKIETEGPWDKRELGMVSQAHLGYTYFLESAAKQAVNNGMLTLKGSAYWHTKNQSRLVPVKVSIGGLQRDFEFYTDEELLRAFELGCADIGSIPKSELIRFTARFLGFTRTTRVIRSRLELLISRAIRDGYIKEDGENYRTGSYWRHHISNATPAPYSLSSHKITRPVRSIGRTNIKASASRSLRERTDFVTSQEPPSTARLPLRRLIATACSEKKSLKIRYSNAYGDVTNRVVDILGMGTNYFDAFDHLRNEQRTFRVDRVIKAEWTDDTFRQTPHYSPSQWVTIRR